MKRMMPLALAAAGAHVAAQALPMEHVLVSVPLHRQTAETALPVTVFSGDTLRRAAAATIGDTLAATPGLANASFGPGVGQPVVRGQQGPRVSVLQNGTASADASALSADHAVSVEPLLADSIEVLRGPATLLYGGGAIGGVVNVIDNRIPTAAERGLHGGAEYRYDGAADTDNVVFRAEGGNGRTALHLDGLYRDWNDLRIADGAAVHAADAAEQPGAQAPGLRDHLDNTDGRTRSITLGGSYHFERGFAGLAVNRLDNEYGIPAGVHGHHEREGHDADEAAGGIRLEVEQTRYDGALHLHRPLPGIEVLRAFLTHTDYAHREIESDGALGTRYSNATWEARAEVVHMPVGDLHGVFGLQLKSSEFAALGEEAFIPVTDSGGAGLFVVEDYHRGHWTFEAGLRLDRDTRNPDAALADKRSFNSFSLSGSALWDVADDWQLGLALSRAERAPAIEELYSNAALSAPANWLVHAATDAIELGNPQLDTEVSRNIDLTIRWNSGAHQLHVTAFYNDFSDYIGLVNTGIELDHTPVMAYTQGDAEFYGVEFDSEFALAAPAGGRLLLEVFGDRVRGTLDTGADAPRLPPLRVGARLAWEGERLSLWTRVVDAADQDRPGVNEADTPGYTRWDLGADYRWPMGERNVELFAAVTNLGDDDIRLSTSFLRDMAPEAGRSLELGLRYIF
ncbi:MAG: TonB-dependent receptor [Halioglobus sp.]|nr:TonB-dependent receptor [Halioglobus sp.]